MVEMPASKLKATADNFNGLVSLGTQEIHTDNETGNSGHA